MGGSSSVARRPLRLLRPGILVQLDRAFDANVFLREVAATGAELLARSKSTRHPCVPGHLPDGSYPTFRTWTGWAVRIIEAELAITGADGSHVADRYQLITTLTDHHRFRPPVPCQNSHNCSELVFSVPVRLLSGTR
jgi:hypothetical protein